MDCGLPRPKVIAFVIVIASSWPSLDILAQFGERELSSNTSSIRLSNSSCMGQCALVPGSDRREDNVCETDLCSEDVPIPLVYTDGMFCVRGAHVVNDRDVTITYCKIIPYIHPNLTLAWNISVSNGSLCKAICYNIKVLIVSPSYFTVWRGRFGSADEGFRNMFHNLLAPANAKYCALETSGLEVLKKTSVKIFGECNMEYAVSSTANSTVLVSATANPPDEAVAYCEVACVVTPFSKTLSVRRSHSQPGRIETIEDCPYCFLNNWKVALPVSTSSNVSAQCILTRDSYNFWNLIIYGGSDVSCSVECFCNKRITPDNIHSGAYTMIGLKTGYLLCCIWIMSLL